MNPELIPIRGDGCPSRVRLEAHSAGEEPTLGAHVGLCAHCGPYVASLRANTGAYVKAHPPELFLGQLSRRNQATEEAGRLVGGARRWWAGVLAVGVAAAVVAVVLVREPVPDSRLKGDAFQVFLKRGAAEPTPVRMDQSVEPGDQLRFSYRAPVAGWLAVFELDGTERVEVRASAEVSAGAAVLPGAIALDDSAGPEWFVAVFATTPLDVEGLAAQLRGQARTPRLKLQCGQCKVEAVRVVKGAP
ncbi:MAG: hypothetical protein Q8N23_18050 [Archangium sp.]|nr:hypothetical protein [Archangium sp.]MDP3154587.1 hypothetical protein [Archangium sp.]MDP3574337.1 hypothetical protein [Archangium sp.]